jgi:hypothetical protein
MRTRLTTTRRHTLRLLTVALSASAAAACIPVAAARGGNRIVATPTYTPDDQQLIPRNWKETRVKLGASVDTLATLNFIQDLQRPKARIPFVMSMTFFAPHEAPLVTIGLYYEKGDNNGPAKNILAGSSFGLQRISDLDAPLRYDASQMLTEQSEKVTSDELGWFAQHRRSIVESMKSSPEGLALGKSWESNFTTRTRPPAGNPAALVITAGNYGGLQVPYPSSSNELSSSTSRAITYTAIMDIFGIAAPVAAQAMAHANGP